MMELMSGHQGLLSQYWSQRPGGRPVGSSQLLKSPLPSQASFICPFPLASPFPSSSLSPLISLPSSFLHLFSSSSFLLCLPLSSYQSPLPLFLPLLPPSSSFLPSLFIDIRGPSQCPVLLLSSLPPPPRTPAVPTPTTMADRRGMNQGGPGVAGCYHAQDSRVTLAGERFSSITQRKLQKDQQPAAEGTEGRERMRRGQTRAPRCAGC